VDLKKNCLNRKWIHAGSLLLFDLCLISYITSHTIVLISSFMQFQQWHTLLGRYLVVLYDVRYTL
jgi:hypothetical protein